MAAQQAPCRFQAADDDPVFSDGMYCVVRARRFVAAVPVPPEVPERAVIGREGVLIQRDCQNNRLARDEPEGRDGIAHGWPKALRSGLRSPPLMISASDLLLGMEFAIAILVLIVLYHVIFIVVDLRKVMRRVEGITEEIEDVVMKPLSMIDAILQWVLDTIEQGKKKHDKKE